jgi:hypothetical protein
MTPATLMSADIFLLRVLATPLKSPGADFARVDFMDSGSI